MLLGQIHYHIDELQFKYWAVGKIMMHCAPDGDRLLLSLDLHP